jgi:hypothetical protein
VLLNFVQRTRVTIDVTKGLNFDNIVAMYKFTGELEAELSKLLKHLNPVPVNTLSSPSRRQDERSTSRSEEIADSDSDKEHGGALPDTVRGHLLTKSRLPKGKKPKKRRAPGVVVATPIQYVPLSICRSERRAACFLLS